MIKIAKTGCEAKTRLFSREQLFSLSLWLNLVSGLLQSPLTAADWPTVPNYVSRFLAVQPISHRTPHRELHSSFKSLTGLEPLNSFIQDRKAHVSAVILHEDFFFHCCGHIPLAVVQIKNNALIHTAPWQYCPHILGVNIFTQLLHNFI